MREAGALWPKSRAFSYPDRRPRELPLPREKLGEDVQPFAPSAINTRTRHFLASLAVRGEQDKERNGIGSAPQKETPGSRTSKVALPRCSSMALKICVAPPSSRFCSSKAERQDCRDVHGPASRLSFLLGASVRVRPAHTVPPRGSPRVGGFPHGAVQLILDQTTGGEKRGH